MTITLQTPSGKQITVDTAVVVIGRDAGCDIALPAEGRLQPRHATIRKVAGKWIIESEGDWPIRVGNGVPGRKCWLTAGDSIFLTESGPNLIFMPSKLSPVADHSNDGAASQTTVATDWFYYVGDRRMGPVGSKQLKDLARTGQLQPTDLIWKEGMANPQPAAKLTGLFKPQSIPTIPPMEETKPPIASEAGAGNPTTTAVQPPPVPASSPATAGPSFLQRAKARADDLAAKAKAGAGDLAVKAKAAARLAAIQAEKAKLVQITLPAAYQELGKHFYSQSHLRDEFAKNFESIDGYVHQLKTLKAAAAGRTAPQGAAEKAKAMALAAKDMAEAKTIQVRLGQMLCELGTAAFEKHDSQSGPDALVQPILECRSRIDALDAQISDLESAHKGERITPKRLAIVGLVAAPLIIVMGVWTMWPGIAGLPTAGDTAAAKALATIGSGITEIEKQGRQIVDQSTQSTIDAAKREEETSARRHAEQALAQQKRLKEQQESKDRREKADLEIAKRQSDLLIQQEHEQADRQALAERYFGRLSFDPASVVLSKSLRNLGATVEFRGRGYTILKDCHKNKDWLGMINYLKADTYKASKYPDPYHILEAYHGLCENGGKEHDPLLLFIKTNYVSSESMGHGQYDAQLSRLFWFAFVLERDERNENRLLNSWIGQGINFDRHPDNVGYFTDWRPGHLYVVGIEHMIDERNPNRTDCREWVEKLRETLSAKQHLLDKRLTLGEIDENALDLQTAAEVARLYDETKKWAESH